MRKFFSLLLFFMFFSQFAVSQEFDPSKEVEKSLVEIKDVVKLDVESYDYINQLLVYYYNNYNSDSNTKNQVKENIHNKLKAKLSEEEYKALNDKWLNKKLK